MSVIFLPFIRVVVGENKNFSSFSEKIIAKAGVEVMLVKVMTVTRMMKITRMVMMIQDEGCIQMIKRVIDNNVPQWNEYQQN